MSLGLAQLDHVIPVPDPKKKKKSKKKKEQTETEDNEIDVDTGNDLDTGNEETVKETPSIQKSAALEMIEEIFNPTLKIPKSEGQYTIPDAVEAGDVEALRDIDEAKVIELKEVFTLFDVDADGYISASDLRATFSALGKEAPQSTIDQMLSEAMHPLDFDAFVVLMGYKTIELDPEDVLLEAWSKWDKYGNGCVEEEKIFYDLTTFGDRFTTKEATDALNEAPMTKPKTLEEPPMIDYQAFCRTLCGLRKRKK